MLGETGAFRDMDFPTRNLYRSAIEELARGAGRTELDVARAAVLATKQAVSTPDTIEIERQGDPGYHLLAGGRPKFEAAIGFRAPLNTFVARRCQQLGIGGYVGAGIAIAAVLLSIPLFILHAKGIGPGWLSLLGLVGTIPAIDVAVALVNRGVTLCFGATPLPALELRGGVPAQLRTLVAVPTMLTTPEAIEAQIERLEVHYLASPDGDLHFALLSDWLDAAAERLDGDAALLDVAVAGIARLNRRHGPAPGGDRFLLLHRKRVWNAGELRWIGWERKRGKLHELNELLRGATRTNFIDLDGQPPQVPAGVRYVITLDADTRLPRDTVHRLIGKMAHPLNRPRYDAKAGRVVAGYGVMQPRVTPSLPIGRVLARVAVIPGRNVIGIELPNAKAETVYLRELLSSETYERANARLALVLGKDIGGAPVTADLAHMPHLLIAGTTGSGKSVGINTMILSLLYRLPPDKCRFIMIDPKMLELSMYDGIPHLLCPVVTDPKKAVVALKWTVREMEGRYRAMTKLGVRNLDGYNQRLKEARAKGEVLTRRVQTGFDPETGAPQFEEEPLNTEPLPLIVVVVDEMADLMLVAGKDIEAAVQRLAQMARAAGIHIVMATQRPSVDVITGTIKANFPTRISFQVTSKIDSRTILGEAGAEQLLGRGDMLYMAGGGRITRVHGPFVSDKEVEKVVRFLKENGPPPTISTTSPRTTTPIWALSRRRAARMAAATISTTRRWRWCAASARRRRAISSAIFEIGYNKRRAPHRAHGKRRRDLGAQPCRQARGPGAGRGVDLFQLSVFLIRPKTENR